MVGEVYQFLRKSSDWMNDRQDSHIRPGQLVQILYPDYAAYLMGEVIGPEEDESGYQTGAWLIQVETSDWILALMPNEFEPVN